MSYGLGVDLGTTYSAAAVARDGVAEVASLGYRMTVVPSVAFVTADGDVLVGDPALRRGVIEPARLAREFKRRMGDSVPLIVGGTPWSAEALTARLLGWIVGQVEEQQGGPADQVTLTYPANWGRFKQERLAQAWRIAGLDRVSLITEPEAAALSYAAVERVPVGQVVAVYDLGGGTFDAAVLRKTATGFEVLGTPEGIERLGGVDIDEAVFTHVCRQVDLPPLDEDDTGSAQALARLRADCVEAKEALSSDGQVSIPVLLPNLHTEVRLTRGELEAMVRPRLEDTVIALRRSIVSAGLTPEDVDRVLLVGGSSRMPLVGELVSQQLGRPFFVDAHPKHAVALGAAAGAAGLTGTVAGGAGGTGGGGGGGPAGGSRPRPDPEPLPVLEPVPVPSSGSPPAPWGPGAETGSQAEPEPGRDPEAVAVQPVSESPEPALGPPPAPPPPGRGRRRGIVAGVAGAVVLVAVAAFVLLRDGDEPTAAGDGGTSSTTTTTEGPPVPQLVETTPVPELPDGIGVDGDDLWVASTFGNTVSRIDAAGGQVELEVPLEGEPLAVLVAQGSIWVSLRADDQVARLDPADGSVLALIDVPGRPSALAEGAGAIWSVGREGALNRIDPVSETATVVGDFPAGTGLVATDEWLWVPYGDNLVAVVDTGTYEVVQEVEVGQTPDVATMAPSGVWVANRGEGTVSRLDPETNEVTATVPVGTAPAGLVADGDWLWVVDNEEGTLVLVHGDDAEVVETVEVGGGPLGVAVTPGKVWVSLGGDDAVAQLETGG